LGFLGSVEGCRVLRVLQEPSYLTLEFTVNPKRPMTLTLKSLNLNPKEPNPVKNIKT
jgi:hypothetical protein